MKGIRVFLLAGFILTIPACSKESLQKAGYETLQNAQQQRCPQEFSSDCPERERYDEYQRDTKDPGQEINN